jgi:PhnB protein
MPTHAIERSTQATEAAIRALLDAFTDALYRKDAAAVIATLSADSTHFDLAPPLTIGPETTRSKAWLDSWFATWRGPIHSTSRDLHIEYGDRIAHAWALQHMTGTKVDGEGVDLWFRATACFRREGDGWRITHMHNSVPFAMDGSGRALLDLAP